jgi:hypothetical protein
MVMAHGGPAGHLPTTSERQALIRWTLQIEEDCLSSEADAADIDITVSHERHSLAHARGG